MDASTIPNSQIVSIYLLSKNANDIKTVALTNPNNIIKSMELAQNMLTVTLNNAYSIQDYVSYGFSNNTWQIGTVDGDLTTLSLLGMDGKVNKQKSFAGAVLNGKKLPQTFTTFTIGPITKGGFPTLNMNGDPANDGGKVSGPANIRIDLLLSK